MPLKNRLMSGLFIGALALSGCGGDSGTTAPPPPPSGGGGNGGGTTNPPAPVEKFATELETEAEAARFLIQAGFGANPQTLDIMVGADAASWVEREFGRTRTNLLQPILSEFNTTGEVEFNRPSDVFWKALFEGNDQLRLRMTFALSQIFVINDIDVNESQIASAYYMDIISRNAFGNFRDLLQDVTYSPAMADYLTYLRNRKGDPEKGRIPDENFAREVLQLFTIGLVELNMDGTPKLSGGEAIETYNNDDIRGLAKVFTGLSYKGTGFWSRDDDSSAAPLQMYEDKHSELEKSFLGATIPAGTNGTESIDRALDVIFEHPNVPPFIARQLIQRFTASDPDPAYVERVALAFENGRFTSANGTAFGTGQRGDLKATLAAILLDDTMHAADPAENPNLGKVREPVLKFIQWGRMFDVADILTEESWRLGNTSSPASKLGQHPFRPKSVFNFYRPGFIAPGTQAGESGMTTPEFQIVNEGAAVGYINFMTDFIYDRTGGDDSPARFTPDYSDEIALADDASALVDHLDLLMTGKRMSPEEKSAVINVVETLTLDEPEEDRRQRVQVAILMISSLPSYAVID